MTNPDLEALTKRAAGSRTPGIVLALICGALASLGFLDPTASLATKLGLLIPFGLIALLGLFVALKPASSHPAIAVLRERPGDVRMLGLVRQTVNGRHSQTFLELTLADGRKLALALGTRGDENECLAQASRLAPHATYRAANT